MEPRHTPLTSRFAPRSRTSASEGGRDDRPAVGATLPRVRRTITSLGRLAFVAAAGAGAAVATLGLYSPTSGEVGPGRVSVRMVWDRDGGSILRFPPLGAVSAATHAEPVRLDVRVEQINLEQLQDALGGNGDMASIRGSIEPLDGLTRRMATRTVIGALVVGGIVGALLSRRRWRGALVGGAGAIGVTVVLVGGAWQHFDEAAFGQPRFEGPLERAPLIVEAVQRHVRSFDDVRGRVETLSQQLSDLYLAAAGEVPPPEQETVILHISDIHLNPLGLEMARRLAEGFGVAAVVDTGDLTSFGYPIEARIGDLLEAFPVPYYFVPGNHDSPANRAAIGAVGGVRLLEHDLVRIGPVSLLGIGDPTFTADNRTSEEEADDIRTAFLPTVEDLVEMEGPDVLAIHDPRMAERVYGEVDVVMSGHFHERDSREVKGTRVLTVGSTGADGLESFTVDTDRPYEAELLRFDRRGRLLAVDYVTLSGIGGSFQIDRTVEDPLER